MIILIHFHIYSNVHYIDREGNEQYMTHLNYPVALEKKMKLLSYFKRYMTEHLVKAGGTSVRDAGDVVSRIPHLHTWFRTNCAVVMHLTNGSVQVSIFSDDVDKNGYVRSECFLLFL